MWQAVRQKVNKGQKLSPLQRFRIASLLILTLGMLGVGWWVGIQIENGVVNRTAATTALYVDSFVAPELQELAKSDTLGADHVKKLKWLLQGTSFGKQIVAFNVWNNKSEVLSSIEGAAEQQPNQTNLTQAWRGTVSARLGTLASTNAPCLEVYSPVRLRGTDQIIAVVEFYQVATELQGEIGSAQFQSWWVVVAITVVMYLLLSGFVGKASQTIARQQAELNERVEQLVALLAQNEELSERVRRAVARTAAHNERFLRRISAELHDGPVQDLSLVLLRLDQLAIGVESVGAGSRHRSGNLLTLADNSEPGLFGLIQGSLQNALQEVRAISGGMGLPQLDKMSLEAVVKRVVRVHERRSRTLVSLQLTNLPQDASLPIKITLYRVIQEALNNAYRHGGGIAQRVKLAYKDRQLELEIADSGPGFNTEELPRGEEQLGLSGMQERVESLGGRFELISLPGNGTTVRASLALMADMGVYV